MSASKPAARKPHEHSVTPRKAREQSGVPRKAREQPVAPRKPRERPGTAVIDKGRRSAAAVLDAAAALLAEEGAAGLSTRKIAARAGMHGGNLQYYFRTKQDLVRALLERYIDQSRERVGERMTAGGGSATERLLRGIEEILADQSSAADCAMFRELWALAAHDAEIAAVVDDFYRRYVAEVATMLREAVPGLAAAKATRVATMVVALLEGLSIIRPAPLASAATTAAARRHVAADVAAMALGVARRK